MFGSLILPTTTIGAAVTRRRMTSRSGGGGGGGVQSSPRDHPTMSFSFPSRSKLILPGRTIWRRRRRIRASFTTQGAAASSSDTTLPPRLQLSSLNLYQILRIKHNASSLEIKTAYRKLAKQFHPDALPPPPPPTTSSESDDDAGGARNFMAIHNAYVTLSDPTERARYDLSIQIQSNSSSSSSSLTRRFHRYYSSTAVDGNEDRRSCYGMQTTTRWETDQCW